MQHPNIRVMACMIARSQLPNPTPSYFWRLIFVQRRSLSSTRYCVLHFLLRRTNVAPWSAVSFCLIISLDVWYKTEEIFSNVQYTWSKDCLIISFYDRFYDNDSLTCHCKSISRFGADISVLTKHLENWELKHIAPSWQRHLRMHLWQY